MHILRVYLDNCCYNRPYDDQQQLKIELETKAKLFIQSLAIENKIHLVWSYILDYENSQNSHFQKTSAIQNWQKIAIADIDETSEIIEASKKIQEKGIKNADSLHIACAMYAGCNFFITVDKRIMKYESDKIRICDPVEFIRIWEGLSSDK
jgi:predicted nucleic acid-binding protein